MFTNTFKSVVERVEAIQTQFRALREDEKIQLEKNGNIVSGTVFVPWAVDVATLVGIVRNNVFLNQVFLGLEGGDVVVDSEIPTVTAGIFGSTLSNTVVEGKVFIKDCCMVHSAYIGSGSALINNGVITGNCESDFYGLGSEFVLCEETGGRAITISPDASLETVVEAISSKERIFEWMTRTSAERADLIKRSRSVSAFLGSVVAGNSLLLKMNRMKSVFIAENSACSGSEISQSFIGHKARIDNSVVQLSVVQEGVSVENYAIVENSILAKFSKVSVHGKVVHSFLGSYSGVESGECVSSLIGPFVGFHHQSLCIATYWPAGRGNIGYGANVGSNHSGKAPDCELLAGEGVFFGLAVVVKFPCNFINAPYSLIASGVTCLPQRMEFPFSLINSGSVSKLSGINEISPAWILSDNMFTLIRNEEKFRKRQKANNPTVYNHQVFRADIMRLVVTARQRLESVTSKGPDGIYTDADIAGLGKNYLREATRLKAIDTYSFILRWYGLRGLYRRVTELGVDNVAKELQGWATPVVAVRDGVSNDTVVVTEDESESEWKYAVEILKKEGMNLTEIKSLLVEFSKLDFLISARCVSSKTKDDVRGAKIVGPQYSEFHAPASQHSVCVNAKKNSAEIDAKVGEIISKL